MTVILTTVAEGVVTAIVLCLSGFLLSMRATRVVEKKLLHRGQSPGASGLYAGMLVRLLVAGFGIIAVFFLLGKERAVPCALAMLPLCFLEVMCSMAVHLRRIKHQKQSAGEVGCVRPASPGRHKDS